LKTSLEGDSPTLLEAVNISKGESILAGKVEWAGTSADRKRGLLGRDTMDPEDGIYIVPCKMIHMFGMKFPIDVAFLAADGRVLALHHALKPNRLSRLVFRADGVLEMAAGKLNATGTTVGDIIKFREVPAEVPDNSLNRS